ncbi:MAG: hypothetical protein WDM92_05850 [Caulobacteraceae bacterium]
MDQLISVRARPMAPWLQPNCLDRGVITRVMAPEAKPVPASIMPTRQAKAIFSLRSEKSDSSAAMTGGLASPAAVSSAMSSPPARRVCGAVAPAACGLRRPCATPA